MSKVIASETGLAAPIVPPGGAPPLDRVRNPAALIKWAGIFIIILGAGAALLPTLGSIGMPAVGALLMVAGTVEMIAARLRSEARLTAVLAGLITVCAGLLLMVTPVPGFLRSVTIITVWLIARSILLAITTRAARGRARLWLGLSAATDLVLGLSLLTGLSISTLFVTLFGESPQLVVGFSWILALSFVATGTMLLEVAGCERRAL
jgi:uncharacterized membrane protein HdeD (DUF308 family)